MSESPRDRTRPASGTRSPRPPASDVAFTPAVKAVQERLGSRRSYARMEQGRGWSRTVDEDLAAFIGERDSFYLGTATADGRPYIQHRGGKPGFLKVVDEHTLAFADFSGNRQYISMGNLSENDRVFLFLMDYPAKRRVKIWGRAEVVEGDDGLLAAVTDEDYDGRPERVFRIHVEAWDVNCPQHITPRYTGEQVESAFAEVHRENTRLTARVEELERRLAEAGRSGTGGDADRKESSRSDA